MGSDANASLMSPLSAADFLDWMVAEPSGLYVLGSFNRHITVHSQQRRAINLIHALIEEGGLDGGSIAIVGAGFAGLTAAAYASEKTNSQVTLFEAASRPLWLQDSCANRWLHPGIYDWPLPGSLEPRTTLPVLNWRAGSASAVAAQVRTEWERIVATQGRLHLRFETRVKSVTPGRRGKLLIELSKGHPEPFDCVVLAVGFGLERGGQGRVGYWNDADGLDATAPGASVLVSGFGDGGLADVLRLCLPEISQDRLVELVRTVPNEVQRQLTEWELRFRHDGAGLDQSYTQLHVKDIVQQLRDTAGALARVTLIGQGHLYGPRSAILNRFLISQLRQARGKAAFDLVEGRVDGSSLTESPNGRQRIKFSVGKKKREFDHVVLRLGPDPSYKTISPISSWKARAERSKHWYETPQAWDRTRLPLWEESNTLSGYDGTEDSLAYESSSSRWCLVLQPPQTSIGHPPQTPIDWAVLTRLALEDVSKATRSAARTAKGPVDTRSINTNPLVVCSQDAVRDPTAIDKAVRLMCAADILVADITGYDPSLLLLLGIRAAVRRGITITCTQQQLTPELWEDLPFNLKELNLVSFYNQTEGKKELAETLYAGLTQSSAAPRYLDLPVYDYVRERPAEGASIEGSRVLLLRAFKPYTDARALHVENRIRSGLGISDEARVEAVIDQMSPRLAGQRLYEAIRHWPTCVVDLTWWRANVLFELGVRLAVRKSRTFCLIDRTVEGKETFKGSRSNLKELFDPVEYDLGPAKFPLVKSIPSPIYEAAARYFQSGQDRFSEHVDAMLVGAAAVMPGRDDPLQSVDVAPLYARDNLEYGEEVRQSAFERLCAAWCYLADREEPDFVRPIDLLDPRKADAFRRFLDLGSRLKTPLALRCEARDKRLKQRIDDSEARAKASGVTSMSELLDAWKALRRDPPWKDIRTTRRDPKDISNWKRQIKQLAILKTRLEQLASPVCELPLQGLKSDLRRLRIELRKNSRRIS
jgi:hypothetical protein